MGTTIAERLRAVEVLVSAETGQAIPELARLERQAPGWVRIALTSGLGFGAAAVVLVALGWLLVSWSALVVQLLSYLLRQVSPRSADNWLVSILLATAAIVFLSARWRALMSDEKLWRHTRAAGVAGYAHLAASAPVRAGMTLLAASFLPFTLFAPVYVFSQWRPLSAPALAALREVLPPAWGFAVDWLPLALLVLAPFLFVDRRQRALRRKMIVLAFVLCGCLAVIWLLDSAYEIASFVRAAGDRWPLSSAAMNRDEGTWGLAVAALRFAIEWLWRGLAVLMSLSWPWLPLAAFLALGLAYPLGASYTLARILYLPYALFRNTWAFVAGRAHLRRRTSRVLNDHIARNRQRVRGDGWGTVCTVDLRRYDERRGRRAYLWPIAYHLCPVCGRDTHAYNNVACISVLLDESMTDPVRRQGRTLYLNGLWWSDKHGQVVEAPFESLVIGPADHLAVEQFVVHCEGQPDLCQALLAAPCRVAEGQQLHGNIRNMLPGKVREIATGFKLADDGVPCHSGLRREALGKRQVRRGLRALLVLLALTVLVALLAIAWSAVPWLWGLLVNHLTAAIGMVVPPAVYTAMRV